jgi:hypothetical protein
VAALLKYVASVVPCGRAVAAPGTNASSRAAARKTSRAFLRMPLILPLAEPVWLTRNEEAEGTGDG